ncbi:MAG TPA: sensor histidine kinase [Candidatus Limiplasma sp.]|nr:sensor histidine kinase [Candidatus Limiplasma sp.]
MAKIITEWQYGLLRTVSIKKRLFIIWGVVLLLMNFALFAMLSSTINNHEAYVSMRCTQLVNAVADQVKAGITSLLSVTKYPVVQINFLPTDTYNYLAHPDSYSKNVLYSDLEYKSTMLFEQNREIRLIAVFDLNGSGSYVKNNKKYTYMISPNQQPLQGGVINNEPWFADTLPEKGSPLVLRPDEVELNGIYLSDKEEMLFVSRAIMSVESFEPIGVILAAVDVSVGTAVYEESKVFDDQRLGFFDADGKLLMGSMSQASVDAFLAALGTSTNGSPAGSFRLTVKGKDFLYHYSSSLDGYYFVLETPYRQILSDVIRQKMILFAALFVGCILLGLAIIAIVRSIVRPVKSLADTCNDIVQKEDFSISIADPFCDELSELTAAFNAMTRRIEYLIYDVYEKNMELTDTQLQLLRSQVNPHFLYNTLETIRTKAYLSGQQELSDMTLLLVNLLRYGISAPAKPVSVEEEILKLQEYIALQHQLYGDRFTVSVNIEPEILGCKMHKFVLQPLVENALYHGVNDMKSIGAVDVLGYADGDRIIFQITDNGSGIPGELLEDLREYMENKNEKFTSIGLKNVHRRIRLLYGEPYGVTIASEVNVGTMITVTLPLRRE